MTQVLGIMWIIQMRLSPKNENIYLCEIELTNKCNYRCSYCDPHSHLGSNVLDYEDILWYIDKLIENDNTKTYNIRLYGGEPIFYPYIDILLEELYNRGVTQHFVTNASRPVKWWIKAQQFLSGCIISVHMQYAKIQHIINVCKTFDTDKPVYVQALVDPLNWNVSIDNATKMHNELIDFKNIIVIRKVVDSDRNDDYEGVYTHEQKDFLLNWDKHFPDNKDWNLDNNIVAGPLYWKINGIEKEYIRAEAKLTGKDNFFGWLCNAGIDGTIIDSYGEVYKSACTKNESSIGNIKKRKVNTPVKGIICDKNVCNCLTDLQFRKFLI